MNPSQAPTHVIGRYALYGTIASGGMATVHFGRLLGPVGFSRTVAIKRLHPQFSSDPEFVAMFLDEARLAARIRHPNVVPTLDVVATNGELFLVMDYVPGESLARLVRAARQREATLPPAITVAILAGVLHGLHAAHEATNERGEPLGLVHRDVSPQNVLVGSDGQARVLDFGVAKAAGRVQTTREGQLKGKLSYMAPEQLRGNPLDRQTDIYAASVVLWEALSGDRLFRGENEADVVSKVLEGALVPPSHALRVTAPAETRRAVRRLDEITMRGLARDPLLRFATARDMALALEEAFPPATASEVSHWIEEAASEVLMMRAGQVGEIESSSSVLQRASLSSRPPPPPDSMDPNPVSALLAQRTAGATPRPVEAPPSDALSSISVSSFASTPPEDPNRGRRGATFAALGLAVLVLLSFGVVVRHRAHLPVAAGSAKVEAPSPLPARRATSVATAPAASSTVVAPVPSVSTAPVASAPAKTEPTSAPTAAEGHAHRGASHAPSHPVVDCTPPFTYDESGLKHYKPECL